MNYGTFGNSGIKVSKIGLGLAAIGRPGYINLGHHDDLPQKEAETMEQQAHQLLTAAYEAGVNYFDAARSYGKAEDFLKSWLLAHPRSQAVIGSKWGYYYTANWEVEAEKHEIKEHTLARLKMQWPESKSRLFPQLKIYHIHSATFESGVLENTEVLEELHRMKSEEGILIGLSLSGANQAEVLETAMNVKVSGEMLFGSVQATYNILEPSVGEALVQAAQAGWGVIVKEAVANGRLTDRNRQASYFRTLEKMAEVKGVSVDALALAFVLKQPFVSVVLSGATTVSQLQSNLKALDLELSTSEMEELKGLAQEPSEYWKERSALKWN